MKKDGEKVYYVTEHSKKVYYDKGDELVEFYADYSIEELSLIVKYMRARADTAFDLDNGDAETLDRIATKLEGDLDDNETELQESE
tara:strand:- start:117 stop:374 length:258 start_codon:yes stop_codon:yes gene_type:complete